MMLSFLMLMSFLVSWPQCWWFGRACTPEVTRLVLLLLFGAKVVPQPWSLQAGKQGRGALSEVALGAPQSTSEHKQVLCDVHLCDIRGAWFAEACVWSSQLAPGSERNVSVVEIL